MARAKRGKNGRFKRKTSTRKKRRNPTRRKRRTYAKKRKPARRKRRTYAKKRRNPTRRKRRTYTKKRRYKKRRNPKPMIAGLNLQDIAVFTGALIGVEYANQQLFGPKYRHGWMGGLVKLGTALGLAFAVKKLKIAGASTVKAIQLAGVTHAAVSIANEAMARIPASMKLSKPLLGERQYRLLGERQYRALGAGNRPSHLGNRSRYGRSLPRHLVSKAGK